MDIIGVRYSTILLPCSTCGSSCRGSSPPPDIRRCSSRGTPAQGDQSVRDNRIFAIGPDINFRISGRSATRVGYPTELDNIKKTFK